MKNQPEQVAKRFSQYYIGDVVMSAIKFAELEYGVAASDNSMRERRNLAALVEDIPVESFGAFAGSAYGLIRKATRDRKNDHLDKLIAAHAVALGVIPAFPVPCLPGQ